MCLGPNGRAVDEPLRKHVEIWERTETAPIAVDGLVDKQERDLLINTSDCPIANGEGDMNSRYTSVPEPEWYFSLYAAIGTVR